MKKSSLKTITVNYEEFNAALSALMGQRNRNHEFLIATTKSPDLFLGSTATCSALALENTNLTSLLAKLGVEV